MTATNELDTLRAELDALRKLVRSTSEPFGNRWVEIDAQDAEGQPEAAAHDHNRLLAALSHLWKWCDTPGKAPEFKFDGGEP